MSLLLPTVWTVHLARQRPGRAIVSLAMIALVVVFIARWSGSALMTALSALLLAGSISEFLLPVTYTLDPEGAHQRHWFSHRVLSWQRVHRVYMRPDGIKLSPLVVHSWVDSYRGIFLRTDDRDAVLCTVQEWLEIVGVTPDYIEES